MRALLPLQTQQSAIYREHSFFTVFCSQTWDHIDISIYIYRLLEHASILAKNRQSCSAHPPCFCHPVSLVLLHALVKQQRGLMKLRKEFVELNGSAAGPRSVSESKCSQVSEKYCDPIQIQFARLSQPSMAAPMHRGLSSPCSKLEGPISRRSPGAAPPFSPIITLIRLAACTRLRGSPALGSMHGTVLMRRP